jgi:hypothetical protein
LSIKALKKAELKPKEEAAPLEETAFSTLGDILEPAMSRDNQDANT